MGSTYFPRPPASLPQLAPFTCAELSKKELEETELYFQTQISSLAVPSAWMLIPQIFSF